MLIYLYRILINIVFIFSPIIIILRLFKNKEDFKRFKEKFCIFSHKKKQKKLIWFHGASVCELLSVIPLINKLEKDKNVDQILVTTSTLSSFAISVHDSSKLSESYKPEFMEYKIIQHIQ